MYLLARLLICTYSVIALSGCSTGFYTHMERNDDGKLVVESRERYFILGSYKADKDKVEIKPVGADLFPKNFLSVMIGAASTN